MEKTRKENDRRRFLLGAAGAGAALALLGGEGARAAKRDQDDDEVSPTEDLMREHGVLRRLLLVYREVIRRVGAKEEIKAEPIAHSAAIIRAFIEDYHERDEEQYIFPRVKKAGRLGGLVDVLLAQHQAGRKLTAQIERLATPAALATGANRQRLAESMGEFVRMYEPHAAREDTILFPAFASLVGEKELHELMELFEKKEHALPMGDFEKMVAEVAKIEQSLGIYDLALFTPKV